MGHIDDFCAYFANRGWAVLQPATMDHQLQHPDWTLQGEWSWDAMTSIDICESYPSIDMDRIAVCGLSTGGHLAMNLLALDQRIKAGVVGCVLSTWNHYEKRFRMPLHCDCGIHRQLSPVMEQCDWAALAAPKPLQFQHGRKDPAFCPGADEQLLDLNWNTGILPPEEYDAAFAEISRAYDLYGKTGQVTTIYHDGPHSINNEKAFDWLMNVL
jgi:dienelactone hydrolase